MQTSLAVQLVDLGFYVPERRIVRRLRKITGANVGHSYSAELYVEYSDGAVVFLRETVLAIDETRVRLRVVGTSVWEENIVGAPGWFRCSDPNVE